jgi:hypothetical protein
MNSNNYELLALIVLFVIIIVILVWCLLKKSNEGFNGIVPVENMLAVTELISEAKDRGCKVDDVILEAQKDPYNRDKAAKAVAHCNKYCPGLSKVRLDTLANIPGYFNNYMDQSGGCCGCCDDPIPPVHDSCC